MAAALAAGEAWLPTARAFAQSVGQAAAGARVAPALGPAVSVVPSGPASPGIAPLSLGPRLGSPALLPVLVVPVGAPAAGARLGEAGAASVSGARSQGGLALPAVAATGGAGSRGLAGAALAGRTPGAKGGSIRGVNGERAPPRQALSDESPELGSLVAGEDGGSDADLALADRARQDARFDGAARLQALGEVSALEASGLLGPATLSPLAGREPRRADPRWGYGKAGLAELRQAAGRAAVPGQGRRLPPAPGSRPPSVAPSASQPAASKDFRRTLAETLPLTVLMAVHSLGLVLSIAALAAGLGWAAAGGAAIVGGGLAYQWKRLPAPEPAPLALPEGHRTALVGAVSEILDAHLAKLGHGPELRPRIVVSNDHGPYNAETGLSEAAVAQGRGLGPDSTIAIGEGLLFRTREHVSGMLAHELGHLVLGHDTPLSRTRGSIAMSLGLGAYRKLAYWGWGLGAAAWFALAQDPGWGAAAAAAAAALAWTLAGFGVLYAAFLAGLSTYRREEHQADRFAAGLDGARGWASALQHSLDVRGEVEGGWWTRLHALHPTYAERIRRLLSPR